MRTAFCLTFLLCCAVLLQVAVLPAFLPPVLRPDLGILISIAVLAFAEREAGLLAVFALGVQADLFGSAKFGLLTLCYMLAAGIILWIAWRELTRGDILAAWVGGIAGTILAHGLYVPLGRLCGHEIPWAQATGTWVALLISACVWGLPVAWACGNLMYQMNMQSDPVRERWAAEARLMAARRNKIMRA
jgi:hypothetical protein